MRGQFRSDAAWLVVVAGCLLVLSLFWTTLYWQGAAATPLLTSNLTITALGLPPTITGWLLLTCWRIRHDDSPARGFIQRSFAAVPRLTILALGLLLVSTCAGLFGAIKFGMPFAVGFWADQPIADFERLLLGHDPAHLLKPVFDDFVVPIEACYYSWLPLQLLLLYILFALPPSRFRAQAISAYFLGFTLLGTFVAYVLPSVGPIFYDRLTGVARFDPEILVPTRTGYVADYLWDHYSARAMELGGGISAFPSLHVAIALWFVLVLRRTILVVPAFLYFAIICIGSVLLGWHYVSDGAASIVGMALIWRLSGQLAAALEPREIRPASTVRTA
ncbi:hypothetical protein HMF7854_01825 [Sphingomonas ginkgonis]|uniref:Inositolphosphotransferase Aur1/Ipt1 domain-containing protein n=1 Tax=Sphingomonas ginkgonis TaxID=2315330 RepID=A0A3R9YKN5_9SPHN|nr:phosphatase PAP2 family protein [Sphingomonas ginkgonis]RST29703.1 hypothetical protein HMF7854_01825 [Sphingomonas ginkgonis]